MSSTLSETRVHLPPTGSETSLESGDHLTRAEFEQRYQRRPDVKKAELIEGVVYMPSPARLQQSFQASLAAGCCGLVSVRGGHAGHGRSRQCHGPIGLGQRAAAGRAVVHLA